MVDDPVHRAHRLLHCRAQHSGKCIFKPRKGCPCMPHYHGMRACRSAAWLLRRAGQCVPTESLLQVPLQRMRALQGKKEGLLGCTGRAGVGAVAEQQVHVLQVQAGQRRLIRHTDAHTPQRPRRDVNSAQGASA
jgi:hypothetical protein